MLARAFVLLVCVFSGQASAADSIRFGLPVKDDSKLFAAFQDIYKEAFQALGLKLEMIPCAPHYCGALVRDGKLDGEAARHREYSVHYPQLDRVEFVVLKLSTVGVTKQTTTILTSASDLIKYNYKISYQIGYRGYEKKLKKIFGKERLTSVTHWNEGLEKVKQESVGVYVGIKQILLADKDQEELGNYKIHTLGDMAIDVYPFLGPSLVQYKNRLLDSLNNMKREKRIEAIFKKHRIPL